LYALAATTDIVIASFKPGDASKLGVDFETLAQINNRIIYGEITGYGPNDSRVGYDAVIQAESGFMSINGEKGGTPLKMPVALIDILAAHQLKEGLLIALLERERTGKGSKVEVSLMDTALASLANQASNWHVGRFVPSQQGSLHPNIAPYGEMFVTRDNRLLLLAVGTDKQFVELLLVLGLESIADDARFLSNERRVANRGVLAGKIAEAIQQLDADKIMEEMMRRKIPASIVRDIREALETDNSRKLQLSADGLTGMRTYVSLSGGQPPMNKALSAPPHLGQHTDEVLSALSASF
jgi:crotonobetainyl-CoA:carnitine CoA-transferase CaiB-like acyl-CoA transferase